MSRGRVSQTSAEMCLAPQSGGVCLFSPTGNSVNVVAMHYNDCCDSHQGNQVNTFLERLNNNQLTKVDQYRKMQKANSDTAVLEVVKPVSEEWKTWQLAPVGAGAYSQSEQTKTVAGAEDLQRALRKV